MPTPTIPDGELFFNATLYTGNGGNLTVTNGAAGQSFQPDFVWTKSRSNGGTNHLLEDVIRGPKNSLLSNGTNAELARGINAFLSNGFSFNDDGAGDGNVSGQTYVAWQWKAGGAAVTNTAGSISSQVSANTTSGFSVVTYTGNGTTGATVGHGLGVTPSMVIVKKRSSTGNWITYHTSTGVNQYLYLNQTAASATATPTWGVSSTTVTFQQSFGDYNDNGVTYVAYCWSQIAGYSAFGSYTGNGSTDGPFIYTGFRPAFVMIKQSDTSGNDWIIRDNKRAANYNVISADLFPNTSGAETSDSFRLTDFVSNGFKIRNTGSGSNTNGSTYIYMAFAENPFKYANAR